MNSCSYTTLPSNDRNDWYYPSVTAPDSDEETLQIGVKGGNWGKKTAKGARWIRRGKKVAWGPARDEWEVSARSMKAVQWVLTCNLQAEERARKRLKCVLPRSRSPSPPSLPHIRSPSPPLIAPYPPPNTHHLSYASFVLDPAVAHSFRSNLLTDLEHATANLIEGETTMGRALGRLWQVMSEDPGEHDARAADRVIKPEDVDDNDEEEIDERERRIARAPDLTSPMHRLLLTEFAPGRPAFFERSHLGSPEMQRDNLEKSVAALKELQDDGREYVERLEEIREGLGDLRAQRNLVWTKVRENALKELKEVVANSAL